MFLHPNFLYGTGKFLTESTIKRRDVWHSREEAHKLFRERSLKSWDPRVIDLYVVRIHSVSDVSVVLTTVQRYGLRELPTLAHPDKVRGVTLKCTKVQEAVRYCCPLLPTFLDSTPFRPHTLRTLGMSTRDGSSQLFARMSRHMSFSGQSRICCALSSISDHERVLKTRRLYSPTENQGFVKEVAGDGFQTTSLVENAGHLVSLCLNSLTFILNAPSQAVQHNPAGVAKVIWSLLRGAPVVRTKL